MDSALETKVVGNFRYQVFLDCDSDPFDMDFENEEDEQAYRLKFEKGELSSYGVVKSEICGCCDQWKTIDSLWGMHSEYAEEALNDYLAAIQ